MEQRGNETFAVQTVQAVQAVPSERAGRFIFGDLMKIEILRDPAAVARKAAEIIAVEAGSAVAARGRFVMAVSGGDTPWNMLRAWQTKKYLGKRCTWCRLTSA